MVKITSIYQKKVFDLEEANQVIKIINHITEDSRKEIKVIINKIKAIQPKDSQSLMSFEQEAQAVLDNWYKKVKALGANSNGLFLVTLDSGKNLFSWRYPEAKIEFYYEYNQSFKDRKRFEDAK